LIESAIKSS